MLRVLIDGRKINDGGIGTYTRALISGLLEQGIEIGVFTPINFREPIEWQGRVSFYPSAVKKYSLREYFAFPPKDLALKYDLFHVPHYTTPIFCPILVVATVHDVIHFSHPERWYYKLVSFILLSLCMWKARKVIAVSKATHDNLLGIFGGIVRSNKIVVIPNPLKIEPLRIEHSLEQSFLLSVCSQNKPHKGVENLLAAYKILKTKSEEGSQIKLPPLILVGQGTAGLNVELEGVQVRGIVSDQELASLYRDAVALVVPSLAEGFCLPAIEAHAVGTPIVTTPVPAILEIVTDGDSVATGFSEKDLAEAILKHLKSEEGRGDNPKIKSVSSLVDRFSPKRVAERTVEIYRSAIGKRD